MVDVQDTCDVHRKDISLEFVNEDTDYIFSLEIFLDLSSIVLQSRTQKRQISKVHGQYKGASAIDMFLEPLGQIGFLGNDDAGGLVAVCIRT